MAAVPVPRYILGIGSNIFFPEFKKEQQNYAKSIGGHHHPSGYLFAIVSQQEWDDMPENTVVDIHGNNVLVPKPTLFAQPAPLLPNATANARATHVIDHKNHVDQIALLEQVKRHALLGIGEDNIDIIEEPHTGTRNLTSIQIMQSMDDMYGEANALAIAAWIAELAIPHSNSITLVKTLANHRRIHTKLATAEQPLSEYSKIKHFESVIVNDPGARQLLADYKKTEPRVRDQEFMALMNHFIIHEPSLTTGTMGFSANAAATLPQIEAMIDQRVEAAFARGLAAGARGPGSGRFAGRGARGGRGLPPGNGRGAGQQRRYCHLHGYDNSHNSAQCHHMAADTVTYSAAMRASTSHFSPPHGNDSRF